MKTLLLLIVIAFPIILAAQEIPPDLLKKMENTKPDSVINQLNQTQIIPDVPKGRITLLDGLSYRFRNLTVSGDSVTWTKPGGRIIQTQVSEIKEITEPDPKILSGMGFGTAIGLVSGAITGALAYPEDNFLETLIQIFSSDEEGPRISKKAIPIIVGMTVAGSAIGTLIGLDNRRTVYRSGEALQIRTEIFPVQGQNQGFLLTLSLSF